MIWNSCQRKRIITIIVSTDSCNAYFRYVAHFPNCFESLRPICTKYEGDLFSNFNHSVQMVMDKYVYDESCSEGRYIRIDFCLENCNRSKFKLITNADLSSRWKPSIMNIFIRTDFLALHYEITNLVMRTDLF